MTRREFLASSAALPQAVRRPNILFLFPDQWRFDWTGLNRELPVRTPNLEALAARGVRFTRAVVASPLCAPSRACLAAGKEYERCGVRNNGDNFPVGNLTYYRLLRDAGYHVSGCGKFDLAKADNNQGLDGKRLLPEWGFSGGINNAGKLDALRGADEPRDPYMAYLHRRGLAAAHVQDLRARTKQHYAATFPTSLPEEAYCDNWLSNNGVGLLRDFPKDRPWHLVVNFTGPHPPMDITRGMDKLCRDRKYPQPHGSTEYTPETHIAIRQNYTAMIENIDRWCGRLIAEVRQRGELDNTLIVFSSDHGEMLGERGRWGKVLPFQPSIGVPLVIAGPGVAKGVRSDALVSVMDLAATYLDYAGVRRPREMDSRSLRPLLEARTRSHREYVLSGLNDWRMTWDGRYKLIRGFEKNPPMLFNLEDDPQETTDLAARQPEIVKRLSGTL